jgi:hypothetical protein
LSEQTQNRRVPLKSMWIKGIRTWWLLRKEILVLWVAGGLIPSAYCNLRFEKASANVFTNIGQWQLAPVGEAGGIMALGQILRPAFDVLLSGVMLQAIFAVVTWAWLLKLAREHVGQQAAATPPLLTLRPSLRDIVATIFIMIFAALVGGLFSMFLPPLAILAFMVLFALPLRVYFGMTVFPALTSALTLKFVKNLQGGAMIAILFHLTVAMTISLASYFATSLGNFLVVPAAQFGPNAAPILSVLLESAIMILVFAIPVFQISFLAWITSLPQILGFQPTSV